ncbi:MAG: bifunctional phosphopantothenoylcysteine decarboxylase/phosphopantothenate--cysteine ligase CoaBC [Bacteroidales bacterium]|nr:bifunctional phosphopantothenoylcysteine decarboxylase/phosphopantothenate--cysteine ligase CoaBC [Bacteroidales bacterium]
MMLKGKKILIGVTGGISAYKIPLLIRLLKKEGAEVQVVITKAAADFVTPLTLSTLSQNPVYSDFFLKSDGTWISHIDLGRWADIILIAPVTATTLGKMAHGIADNLLVATYLAARCPVLFAPAMDMDMFLHPSTQANIARLKEYGHFYIEPETGYLASGLTGPGRLKEPADLFDVIIKFINKPKDFQGLKVLVTAGPTLEPIDPVRFIGNRSSGRMGYAIADEIAGRGAVVDLVSGPVNVAAGHHEIHVHRVETASEMFDKTIALSGSADIIIMAAAVADYTPADYSPQKIKKEGGNLSLNLKKTRDILMELGKNKRNNQTLIGFALETDDGTENAGKKLAEKNLDFIVLNSLTDKGAGFESSTNKITILRKNGEALRFELKDKKEVARDIADNAIIFHKKRLT